ncbi:MAG: TonB-dependent receptor [Parvibaculum sp.]|nr:TonB-dependent receptor [Parvibaculum sp.]
MAIVGFLALSASRVWAQDASPSAQTGPVSFSIPAQRLVSAIDSFSRITGWQVGYSSPVEGTMRTQAVSGVMSPEDALRRMVAGTGPRVRMTGPASAALINPEAAASDHQEDGSLLLDTITVATDANRNAASGSGYQGTPDWVYDQPESVSVLSREAVQNSGVRDTRDLMGTVSGVYSGEGNGSFPTVSPNIRGMQDAGRVVISIDGARQNAQRGYGFGSGGYQSNAGQAYVDSAFVRTVEIDKDPDARAGNAGALAGSVNFRTVGADDLIADGKNWGLEVNATRGTNEYDFQGSILGAARLGETPFSITAGFSKLDMGEYAAGTHGRETNASQLFKGRDAFSSLLKLEGDFGDIQTTLSWMHQEKDFKYGASRSFENLESAHVDTVTGDLSWNPDSNLIDMNVKLWLNDSRINEFRESRLGTTPDTNIDMDTLSFGGVLDNTSIFDTPAGVFDVNYGAEAFRDDATASASSESIDLNPTWASRYTAFSPPGSRDVASAFANADWEVQDWLTLSGGLRYDWYRLHGQPTYYNKYTVTSSRVAQCVEWIIPGILCGERVNGILYLEGQTIVEREEHLDAHRPDIDRSGGEWLPALKAEIAPVDWFNPYVSYSHSFRPPTVLEAFFTGGLPGEGVGTNFAPNTELRPERARTFEVGTNVSLDGIFMSHDSFRLKVAAFKRDVDDYIVLGNILAPDVADKTYLSFVNLDGVTTFRGRELEGNYDAGLFWLGASATWLDTSWATSTQVFSNGTITTDGVPWAYAGNVPPEFKATIDGGVRLIEQRLQLGARLNHVTPTMSRFLDSEGNLSETTEAYTTVDVYGSLRFNTHATLRMAVNNLADLNYIPASGTYNAPGRTFTTSLNLTF